MKIESENEILSLLSDRNIIINQQRLIQLVEVNVRFTRTTIKDQNTLLSVIYVQPKSGVKISSQQIRDRLTNKIQANILQQGFDVTPLVNVIVLEKFSSQKGSR